MASFLIANRLKYENNESTFENFWKVVINKFYPNVFLILNLSSPKIVRVICDQACSLSELKLFVVIGFDNNNTNNLS